MWMEEMATQWNVGATSQDRVRLNKELVNNGSWHLFLFPSQDPG